MSDFESAATEAISQLEALGTQETPAPVVEATETPAAVASEVPPVVETPAAPTPVDLADDALVQVTRNGQPVTVTWKEAKSGVMMQQDYTAKTMEIAEQRRQFEALVNQHKEREAQINAMLGNKQAIENYYNSKFADQPAAPDPTEPVTLETMQAQLAAQQQAMQQELHKTALQLQQDIEIKQEAKAVRGSLDTTWDTLYKEHPVLKDFQVLKSDIEFKVGQMKFSSVEDAQRTIAQLAKAEVAKIDSHYMAQRKAEVIEQAKLKTGIEPPGGKGLTPVPYKAKSFDDPQMITDVTAQIQALMNAGK